MTPQSWRLSWERPEWFKATAKLLHSHFWHLDAGMAGRLGVAGPGTSSMIIYVLRGNMLLMQPLTSSRASIPRALGGNHVVFSDLSQKSHSIPPIVFYWLQ